MKYYESQIEKINSGKLQEVDYPQVMVKRITREYLKGVKYKIYEDESREQMIKPSRKYIAYAWYYVYNGGNRNDAYRRAYYSKYDSQRCKLIQHKDIRQSTINAGGRRLYGYEVVRRLITLIRDDIEKKIKADVPQTLLQQLQIQATYDPSMFIKPNGDLAFKDWEEIPYEFRCCIEGIEPTKYGVKVKLVDRKEAREKLLALAPDLITPNKIEVTHLTKDAKGNEVGIDMSRYTDEQLEQIMKKGL